MIFEDVEKVKMLLLKIYYMKTGLCLWGSRSGGIAYSWTCHFVELIVERELEGIWTSFRVEGIACSQVKLNITRLLYKILSKGGIEMDTAIILERT